MGFVTLRLSKISSVAKLRYAASGAAAARAARPCQARINLRIRCSVSDGINHALFNPQHAKGGTVAFYNISKAVDVSISIVLSFSLNGIDFSVARNTEVGRNASLLS